MEFDLSWGVQDTLFAIVLRISVVDWRDNVGHIDELLLRATGVWVASDFLIATARVVMNTSQT